MFDHNVSFFRFPLSPSRRSGALLRSAASWLLCLARGSGCVHSLTAARTAAVGSRPDYRDILPDTLSDLRPPRRLAAIAAQSTLCSDCPLVHIYGA